MAEVVSCYNISGITGCFETGITFLPWTLPPQRDRLRHIQSFLAEVWRCCRNHWVPGTVQPLQVHCQTSENNDTTTSQASSICFTKLSQAFITNGFYPTYTCRTQCMVTFLYIYNHLEQKPFLLCVLLFMPSRWQCSAVALPHSLKAVKCS